MYICSLYMAWVNYVCLPHHPCPSRGSNFEPISQEASSYRPPSTSPPPFPCSISKFVCNIGGKCKWKKKYYISIMYATLGLLSWNGIINMNSEFPLTHYFELFMLFSDTCCTSTTLFSVINCLSPCVSKENICSICLPALFLAVQRRVTVSRARLHSRTRFTSLVTLWTPRVFTTLTVWIQARSSDCTRDLDLYRGLLKSFRNIFFFNFFISKPQYDISFGKSLEMGYFKISPYNSSVQFVWTFLFWIRSTP